MEHLWLLIIPILFTIYFIVSSIWGKPIDVRILFDRYFIRFVLQNPELLSTIGIPLKEGKLGDASTHFAKKMLHEAKRDLRILRSYKKKKMNSSILLSVQIMEWFLDDMVQGERFFLHGYPVNQMFGIQSEMPNFMATIHRVSSLSSAKNYNKRLNQFKRVFQQVIDGLAEREEIGVIPPKFVLEKVIMEMTTFISGPIRSSLIFSSFKEKLTKSKLTEAQINNLLADCERAIEYSVIPAYRSLIDYCTHLLTHSTTADGVWKLPNGDAYYAYQLHSNTTVDLSPEQVHQIGISEVRRIEGEMKTILVAQGYERPDPIAVLAKFGKDKSFLYPNSDVGRKEALEGYRVVLDHINSDLDHLFIKRPKAKLAVERVPEFKEKTSPAAYYMIPSLDGKRPGVFYANLRDMNEVQKFGMRTLAYHEGIPGHHFQLTLAQEITKAPIFRKVIPFTAYAEGWALYAEKIAREYGFLPDPFSVLGYLQSELMRAVRLVVDTGIHHKRWTREEAIAYMLLHTGMPEASVVSEIERYIVMPGQACAYKIGELKIVALRQKVMHALGKAFDIREFHNVVLQNGAMPLEILEQMVDAYIESKIKPYFKSNEARQL